MKISLINFKKKRNLTYEIEGFSMRLKDFPCIIFKKIEEEKESNFFYEKLT